VRYKRNLSIGNNAPITTTWTATEQFEQVDTLPAAERLNDPGGIIITNYQDEEDTAP
jgi:type IV secretion system protein VirB8